MSGEGDVETGGGVVSCAKTCSNVGGGISSVVGVVTCSPSDDNS